MVSSVPQIVFLFSLTQNRFIGVPFILLINQLYMYYLVMLSSERLDGWFFDLLVPWNKFLCTFGFCESMP
jgi:hypothetical protein